MVLVTDFCYVKHRLYAIHAVIDTSYDILLTKTKKNDIINK